jgi:DNA polymerase III subunit epsilon
MADPDDLEALAARLEQSGDYRILRRVPSVARYSEPPAGTELRRGLIVDVETTGLDPARDKIIELAILPFDFSSAGGSTPCTRAMPIRGSRQARAGAGHPADWDHR